MRKDAKKSRPRVGFVGQGFVGKNYADDFEHRGFTVVRYSLEKPHSFNREAISGCDVVFIAVPTPTTPAGFDDSRIRSSLHIVGHGRIAVIKSTMLPGTTETLQKLFPQHIILHSPEFLTARFAKRDAAHPTHNIIGIPRNTAKHRRAAKVVLNMLPHASSSVICTSREAELFKYLRNCFLYTKVLFMNLMYDFSEHVGVRWNVLKELMEADPWIGNSHLDPVHCGSSGDEGRGAGGPCFIKDFAAFTDLYEKTIPDPNGLLVLRSLETKNRELLGKSGKDTDLLNGVYGPSNEKHNTPD